MKKKADMESLIRLIVTEFDDIDPAQVTPEGCFKEVIEWNSINSVVLSVIIESEFGVLLDTDDYQDTDTFANLLNRIQAKAIELGSGQ